MATAKLEFLEGPAYAGKTTYLNGLDPEQVVKLPEASEYLGGDSNFPEAPHDLRSMLECSFFFSYMENERLRAIGQDAGEEDLTVVADRFTPLSSLIFYNLRANGGDISPDDYATGIQLASQIFADNLQLPDVSFDHRFLLFDVSSEEGFASRLSRGTRNADFNSWQNFRALVDMYRRLLPQGTLQVVDGLVAADGIEPGWESDPDKLKRMLDPRGFLPAGGERARLLGRDDAAELIGKVVAADQVLEIEDRVKGLIRRGSG